MRPIGDLESYANRPDLVEFEWGPLAHKLSLVPWLASRIGNAGIHVWLLWLGAFSLRFRCLEAIQTRMLYAEAHSRFPAMNGPDASKVREFADDVRDGKFLLPIGRRMPLRDAGEAHALAQRGGLGKIVLVCR